MSSPDRLIDLLERAPEGPLVVLGDLIADRYLIGSSGRVSREAPVLILRFHDEHVVPGGAANAAMNLRALGAPVRLVGLVGPDAPGDALRDIFRGVELDAAGVLVDETRGTTVKTRILAGDTNVSRQQVLRIDRDQPDYLDSDMEARLLRALESAMSGARGLLLSDYGQGVLSGALRERAIAFARQAGIPSLADSRHRLDRFTGVSAATPNVSEALEVLPRGALEGQDVVGRAVLELLDAECVFITRGSAGMEVHVREEETRAVGVVGGVDVVDVTGAGDTVAATALLALAWGASAIEAALLASHAAGVVVTKRGTATATADEVRHSLRERWDASSP